MRGVKQNSKELRESDLYLALLPFLSAQGFTVKGEIRGADLVALHDNGTLRIVELKKNFNHKLLYQAVRRLSITEDVYIAIFRPIKTKMSFFTMVRSLARRLNLGVYLVSPIDFSVQELTQPAPFKNNAVSVRKREQILKEFNGRRAGTNLGGVTGVKIQTRYLETAIKIAVLLNFQKISTAAQLKKAGCPEETYSILYKNIYGWFEKADKGQYRLKKGQKTKILREYPDIWAYYTRQVNDTVSGLDKS